MTVVAAKNFKDKITISCDSQVTYGRGYKYSTDDINFPKIFSHNGMTIGVCGDTQECGLFKIFTKNHRPKDATPDSIIEFLVEFSDYLKKRDDKFSLNSDYIMVMDNKIFELNPFEAYEIGDYTAIGSGRFLALGAMELGADTEKAVQVAKKYDNYCGGSTRTLTIKKENIV